MGFSDDNAPIYDSYAKPPKGAYAKHPLATPKYALQKGPRGNDFTDTQARIYLSSPLKDTSKLGNLEPLANAVSDKTNGYVDFILQGVEQGLREKVDVIETLNDHYVAYFFGAAAEQWTFRGTFLNTKEDNQFLAFHEMYEKWLRGTKLADYRRIVALQYNGITVRGALTSLATSLNSEMETAMSFSFTLLVKDVHIANGHDEEFAVINGGTAAPPTDTRKAPVPDVRHKPVPPSQEELAGFNYENQQAQLAFAAATLNREQHEEELERLEEGLRAAGLKTEAGQPVQTGASAKKEREAAIEERDALAASITSSQGLGDADRAFLEAEVKKLDERVAVLSPAAEAYTNYVEASTQEKSAALRAASAKDKLNAASEIANREATSAVGNFTPQPVNVG